MSQGAPPRRLPAATAARLRTILCAVDNPAAEHAASPWRRPLHSEATHSLGPPMVALGKFDALHTGHRALVAAAADLGGAPWLVSFAGIAEVLGWPPRLPLVAPCDRPRVLESWAPHCGGAVPGECAIPFKEV